MKIPRKIKNKLKNKPQWLKYLYLKMSAYPFEKEKFISEGFNHDRDIWLNLDKSDE